MLCIVNVNGAGGAAGEIVEVDETLYASWLDAGWLSPVDDEGHRVTAISAPESAPEEAVAPAGDPTSGV